MENALRRQVLAQFKKLHLTRKKIFDGDQLALTEARKLINDGFKKKKDLTETDEIKKELQLAIDVRRELETNIIQAVETKPGVYEASVRNELLLDNQLFNPEAVLVSPKGRKKCCKENDTESNKK